MSGWLTVVYRDERREKMIQINYHIYQYIMYMNSTEDVAPEPVFY